MRRGTWAAGPDVVGPVDGVVPGGDPDVVAGVRMGDRALWPAGPAVPEEQEHSATAAAAATARWAGRVRMTEPYRPKPD